MSTKKKWYQSGTTWTGIAAIITGVGGIVTNTIPTDSAIQTILGGFAAIFGRKAIESIKE
jgi:hypothetical protein